MFVFFKKISGLSGPKPFKEGGLNRHFAHCLGTVKINSKLYKSPSRSFKDTDVCIFKIISGLRPCPLTWLLQKL